MRKYVSIIATEWKEIGGLGSLRDWLDIFPSVGHYGGVMSVGVVLWIMVGVVVNVVAQEVLRGTLEVGIGQILILWVIWAYLWANFKILEKML